MSTYSSSNAHHDDRPSRRHVPAGRDARSDHGAADPLRVLARSVESLRPAGAPAAWAEITGTETDPDGVRWHGGLDTLIGFVAPADCLAIAAVGYGWARNVDTSAPGQPGALAAGERRRCRVVFVMSRSGLAAGYVRVGTEILIDEPPTSGRIPDLVRRCLGQPTPPPEQPSAAFLAAVWLHNIAAAGAATGVSDSLAWPAVAALHPALQVAADAGIAVAACEILPVLRLAADTWTWSHLTAQSAEPGWLADLLPAGAAGWMDEGILSRWLLDTLSPIDTLLDRVNLLLTPAATQTLRATLTQLGVDRPRPTGA